jgi:hypothetical protein
VTISCLLELLCTVCCVDIAPCSMRQGCMIRSIPVMPVSVMLTLRTAADADPASLWHTLCLLTAATARAQTAAAALHTGQLQGTQVSCCCLVLNTHKHARASVPVHHILLFSDALHCQHASACGICSTLAYKLTALTHH